jgi:DME family drug/metabolite transporter
MYGSACVLAAALLWATTGTAAAMAPEVGPLAIGAAAMGVGGLLQAAAAARAIRAHRTILVVEWRTLTMAAAATAVYPLAFYSSMRLAGVAVGTAVSIGAAPVAAALVERVVDGHRLSARWALGAAFGVAGVGALVFMRGGHAESAPGGTGPLAVLGIALGLLAGATYALYSWGAARVMRRGVPSRPAMGAIFGVGGVLLLPVLLLTGAPVLASGHNLAAAAYLAVVPMFLGYLLFGRGLAHVTASTATTLSLLEPAAATLVAVGLLREQLPLLGWVGMALLSASLCTTALSIGGMGGSGSPAPRGRRLEPPTRSRLPSMAARGT